MAELRSDLPPLPPRFERLPVSDRGYPVPWFVSWLDGDDQPMPRGHGRPEFRVVAPDALPQAWNGKRCWLCGRRTGRHVAFVIGPMCSVNRVNAEPPSHVDCADFAARACPFLARPTARRRPLREDLPSQGMAGVPILRNPGVAAVWITQRPRIKPFWAGNGAMFAIGEPDEVRWYCEGRLATRAEVDASVETGLPLLAAEAEKDGPTAMAELDRLVTVAEPLFPELAEAA